MKWKVGNWKQETEKGKGEGEARRGKLEVGSEKQ